MKAYIETHLYAPELNRIVPYSKSSRNVDFIRLMRMSRDHGLPVPGCRTLAQVRDNYRPLVRKGQYVTVYVRYEEKLKSMNRTYNGWVNDMLHLKMTMEKIKQHHNLAKEFDIRLQLIG